MCGFVYVRRLCCVSVINEITLFLLLLLLPPTGISCFCFLLLAFVFVVCIFLLPFVVVVVMSSASSRVVARWHADSRFSTEFDFVFGYGLSAFT